MPCRTPCHAALLATTLSFASFASAHTDNVKVLHLTAVQVESNDVDVAPTGDQPSLGDSSVFSENLFRDGHKVGISGGVCTFVRLEHPPAALQCVVTARLGRDQLTVQGLAFDQPTSVLRSPVGPAAGATPVGRWWSAASATP